MIGEKIIKIMSEIEPIVRTETNGDNPYKSPKIEKIIGMVAPLLIKNKVIVEPVQVKDFIPQGNKVYLTMVYHFIDVEDPKKDYIEVQIPGCGFDDKGGRAIFAALTGVYRYALQQGFAIPIVDEINNNDEKTNNDENKTVIQEEKYIVNENEELPPMTNNDLESLFTSTTV